MIIRLADINIKIENKYAYLAELCREYTAAEPNFSIDATVSEQEIYAEDTENKYSAAYLESLAVYRKIAESILDFDGFLMHGAVIDVHGCGTAFLAKSGVGKSTHVRLWQQLLSSEIRVINGDKPLIRIIGGCAYAFGTPWAGKEGLQVNAKTKLRKICFIERSTENECIPLEKAHIFKRLINQIYIPKNKSIPKLFDLINILAEQSEFYLIKCNTDISAAKTAYEVIGI